MSRPGVRGPLVLLAALLLCGFPAPGAAGDAETARLLLESGKDSLAKKRFDEAIHFFETAQREDPGLLEALYWTAAALEGRKDTAGSVARYREFLAAYRPKKQEGKASTEEDRIAALASARIAALAAASEDLRNAQDAYVDRLFAFVHETFVSDPMIAEKALRMLLDVRPQHAEATAALAKITGVVPPDSVGEEAAAAGVKKWLDLLAKKTLAVGAGTEYGRTGVTIERVEGSRFYSSEHRPLRDRFVLEVEMRTLEDRGVDPTAGLVFAKGAEGDFLCLMIAEGAMVLFGGGKKGVENLAIVETPVDRKAWHRLTLLVDKNDVEGRLDGKSVVLTTVEGRSSLLGDVGLWIQATKVEIRALRLGTRE